ADDCARSLQRSTDRRCGPAPRTAYARVRGRLFRKRATPAMLEIGGAWGTVPIAVLSRYPILKATIFDLAPVEPVAREHLAEVGLVDRIDVRSSDMFADPLPADAGLTSSIGSRNA